MPTNYHSVSIIVAKIFTFVCIHSHTYMYMYYYIVLFSKKGIFKKPYISEDLDKSMIPSFPHPSIEPEPLVLVSWKRML